MNKDLEVFENRSDDWLAKERKYEESVSAWDFDEGKKVKSYHEENCEARKIKETHEKRHAAYKLNNNQFEEIDGKSFIKLLIPTFIFIGTIGIISVLIETNNISEESFLAVPIIMFIIFVNLAKSIKRRK